jgi:hypothetical protein
MEAMEVKSNKASTQPVFAQQIPKLFLTKFILVFRNPITDISSYHMEVYLEKWTLI